VRQRQLQPAGGGRRCGADQGSLAELKAALLARVLDQSAEALRRRLETLRGTGAGA